MSKITILREPGAFIGRFGKFKIYSDGNHIGTLGWFRKQTTCDIQPGNHTIYMSQDRWKKSNQLEIEIADDQELKFSFLATLNPTENIPDMIKKTGYSQSKGRHLFILRQIS